MHRSRNQFRTAASEAVREELRTGAWEAYACYLPHPLEDGDVYAHAPRFPLGHAMARKAPYLPLVDEPEVFLDFAALADKEITQDVWLDWVHYYGVLGLDGPVEGYGKAWTRGGPEETLSRFVEEARTANKALRLYEAATAPYGPNVATIESYIPEHDRHYFGDDPESVKGWALDEVAATVQERLTAECYPQLYGLPGGNGFDSAPDFKSLLGAMYLQMMFLMTATGEVRRCKAPGCNRVITFESAEEPTRQALERLSEGRRKKYKIRVDKQYCSQRCKVRWHYYNKKREADTS